MQSTVSAEIAKKHGWATCHRCFEGACASFKFEWWVAGWLLLLLRAVSAHVCKCCGLVSGRRCEISPALTASAVHMLLLGGAVQVEQEARQARQQAR